jgi:hypothetical protein
MNTSIKAGVIVQINSINVPWFVYLYEILDLFDMKFLIIEMAIQDTANNIIAK